MQIDLEMLEYLDLFFETLAGTSPTQFQTWVRDFQDSILVPKRPQTSGAPVNLAESCDGTCPFLMKSDFTNRNTSGFSKQNGIEVFVQPKATVAVGSRGMRRAVMIGGSSFRVLAS